MRVSVVERGSSHVADGKEAPEDERVAQSPGRNHEEKAGEPRGGQVRPRAQRNAAVEKGSSEEGGEGES